MFSNRIISTLCAAVIALVASAGMARADQVDNPRYKAWASFKPESNETLSGAISMGPMQATMEMTITLKEVTDDHVIIETVTTMSINGQNHQSPPRRETVNSKMENRDVKELDPEDVKAMDKTFSCKVYSVTDATANPQTPPDAAPAQMKIWANKDVPGGLVKLEANQQRPGAAARVQVTYLLKAFEAK